MTKKYLFGSLKSGSLLIIVSLVMIYLSFSVTVADPFNLLNSSNIKIYSESGEYMGDKYIRVIDRKYVEYSSSPYDYKEEIVESNFIIEGVFEIDEVKISGNKYKIYTKKISGTRTLEYDDVGRKAIIYIDRDKILDRFTDADIKDMKNGVKIDIRGELNNIGDEYYIINNLEDLEVK